MLRQGRPKLWLVMILKGTGGEKVLSGRLASSQSTESCRSQGAGQSIGKVEVWGPEESSSQEAGQPIGKVEVWGPEESSSQEAGQPIGKVEVLGRGCNSSQKGIFVASRNSEGFSIHGTGIFTY